MIDSIKPSHWSNDNERDGVRTGSAFWSMRAWWFGKQHRTTEEALGHFVASVLRTRMKYGGSHEYAPTEKA